MTIFSWIRLPSFRNLSFTYFEFCPFFIDFPTPPLVEWMPKIRKKQTMDNLDLENMDGSEWVDLLLEHPEFAEKCDWTKLDGEDWVTLLEDCPQFADKCDKWDDISEFSWPWLLAEQPQFADKCHCWEDFQDDGWGQLLICQPQFADKCDWSKMDDEFWTEFQSASDSFGEFFDARPELADKLDFSKLESYSWAELLARRPDLAGKCECWSEFEDWEWNQLLAKQPQLAKYNQNIEFDDIFEEIGRNYKYGERDKTSLETL
ncbi:MAG: hypothetical protein ILM98_01755 [Kiritimatiellae bacterium]|nr:hypothetical protein [Kiritimatiellia bacterium]